MTQQSNTSRAVTDAEIRHRFGYHKGTSETMPKHELVREGFIAFAQFLNEQVPDGRAKSTALTNLQQASMWANFGIAELAPLADTREEVPTVKGYAETPVNDETVPPYAQ